MLAESVDGFGLATEHLYSPPVVVFSLCMYLAVEVLTSRVSVPSVTGSESLVQVTVVAGPPVEIQTRVNGALTPSTVNVSIEMSPAICQTSISRGNSTLNLPFPLLYIPACTICSFPSAFNTMH